MPLYYQPTCEDAQARGDYDRDAAWEEEFNRLHPSCEACGEITCPDGCCEGLPDSVRLGGLCFCAGACLGVAWHQLMVDEGERAERVTPVDEDITTPIPVRIDGVSYPSLKEARK